MTAWEKKIPEFLTEKNNIVTHIVFTAAFALVFINIYSPFGVDIWLGVTEVELFFYSSLITLFGLLIIVISRVIMYQTSKKRTLNYLQYSLWIIIEIISLAAVYALLDKFYLKDARDILTISKASIQNTAFVIILPYIIVWLYLSWKEKNQRLEKLSQEDNNVRIPFNMIPFHDEKGVLKFSVKPENLLYLEAADNYVFIYYTDKNKKTKFVIRNTLKKFEESLIEMNIIRCHRSYMVNFDKITIIRKDKDGLLLELEDDNINLPVSKTYVEKIITKFSNP